MEFELFEAKPSFQTPGVFEERREAHLKWAK